ncbi:hypothetical protein OSTOST_25783 [Ostertagia ostertagi]
MCFFFSEKLVFIDKRRSSIESKIWPCCGQEPPTGPSAASTRHRSSSAFSTTHADGVRVNNLESEIENSMWILSEKKRIAIDEMTEGHDVLLTPGHCWAKRRPCQLVMSTNEGLSPKKSTPLDLSTVNPEQELVFRWATEMLQMTAAAR